MTMLKDRLRGERDRLGLSQEELAAKTKIRQSFIGALETGAQKSSGFLPEIAYALGISAYWLKTGKGSRLGGRQLSEEEEALLNALPLLDADVRESWIELAKKKVARLEAEKQKAA